MKFILSITWLPWQASVAGPARQDVHHNLYREVDGSFERLPAVGETIHFEDGGFAQVESVAWKLDGNPFLFLGRRYEKKGETLQAWTGRGFEERSAETEVLKPDPGE